MCLSDIYGGRKAEDAGLLSAVRIGAELTGAGGRRSFG